MIKQRLKWVLVLFCFAIFLVITAIGHVLVCFFPSRRWPLMSRLTNILMRVLLKILGFKIKIEGNTSHLKERGNLVISRHVGYADGLILGALTPAVLVSKKDVKKWPLFGQVIAISGTVFVDRRNAKDFSYLERMTELLRNRVTVIVFPEGTSTNGEAVKAFQSVFFKAPIDAKTGIIPITVSYLKLEEEEVTAANRDDIFWYGQTGFFNHLWNLLRFDRLEVTVTVHEKISVENFLDNSVGRKKLSQYCQQVIAEKSGLRGLAVNGDAAENGIYSAFREPMR